MINIGAIFAVLESLTVVFQILFSLVTSLFGFAGGLFGPFLPL